MRILLLIQIICFTLITFAQDYPAIQQSRPRIYAAAGRLDWIAQHRFQGECGATYNDFLNRYNNNWINDPELFMTGSDTSQWTWTWSSQWAQWQAVFTVFLWRVNHEPLQLKRCRFLVRKCTEYLDTVNLDAMEWYQRETLIRTFSDAASLLLDWCHDSLPASDRQQLALAHYRMQRKFMDLYILSSAGNSYVSSHNALNCVFAMRNNLALYMADGLSSGQQDTVLSWYQTVYDKWINGFLPCYSHYRDDDGGWNWGAAYAMWSLTDQFQLFDDMLFATGKNFYTDLPWVQESINQYWYFIRPDHWTIHLGDGMTGLSADNVIYRHAQIFQDDRSRWLAQYYSQAQFITWTVPVFRKLLYKDFTMPPVAKPLPPLNWWADKVGLSVSRTSWEEDAVLVWFFNSPSKRASHEHRDNNTFAVFHHNPLLIDAGFYDTYGGSHFKNYYTRTIAHNSLCVFDSSSVYLYGNEVVANDGGQIYSPALMNYNDIFSPAFQRGRWNQYAADTAWAYQNSDASLSYDSSRVRKFTRRLLFHKPDRMIVLDHLCLNPDHNGQRDAFVQFHTVNRPQVSGALIMEEVPGHIMTYDGTDLDVENGSGRLSLRTLLPENGTVRLTGGTGYEYWVNGTNYPPLTQPDTLHGTPGKWRLEIRPPFVSDTVLFLHTISIGDTAGQVQAGGSLISNSISTGVDWDDAIYLFSHEGDTGMAAHLAENLPGGRSVTVWAADLKASDSAYIFIDTVFSAARHTGTDGIIQGGCLLQGGNHSLSIGKYTIDGTIKYANSAESWLAACSVALRQNGLEMAVTQSDTAGCFSFENLCRGQYSLVVIPEIPWGGCNSTDALLVLRHFVHLIHLTGLSLKAADVDDNQAVNSLDALYIGKRFIGAVNAFPAGDWYCEAPAFSIGAMQHTAFSLKAVCMGDVNGSYFP
ncbi:MAG TPA: heparinase II/III family protein [Bacteroidales bacterium]|nr:heparinase II/III family protein [Bacteroidales bacterium]HSA43724.1 heparinase II/III family protein [Bacteroidales bacterium]